MRNAIDKGPSLAPEASHRPHSQSNMVGDIWLREHVEHCEENELGPAFSGSA